ncbi:MAG: PAS domain S-box protein [Desulfobacteraceae bacterium]|nr:PAS domain S-box protein [Desulfobacteraceae bacterium]
MRRKSSIFFKDTVIFGFILMISFFISTGTGAEGLNKDFIAGMPQNFPPHFFIDTESGKPTGFGVDVMDAVARRCSITIKYKVFENWKETNQAARDGLIDIIPNQGFTSERKTFMDFTPPYETFRINYYIRATSSSLKSLADIENSKIGVVVTNKARFILEKKGQYNLVKVDSFEDLTWKLIAGDVDCIAMPEPVMDYLMQKSGLKDQIIALGDPLVEIKRGIAVTKGRKELFQLLQSTMNDFILSQDFKNIYTKWYGEPEPYWTPKRVGIVGAILFCFTIFAFVFWRYRFITKINKKLEKTVYERTKKIEESEKRYKQTFETNLAIKLIINPINGDIVEANDAACKYYGYSKEILLSLKIYDINTLPPDKVNEKMEKTKNRDNQILYFQHKLASGEIREVEVFSGPIEYGQHKLLYSIIHDVTDQKDAMKALYQSEEKHKAMVTNISDVIGILDAKGIILYKSPNIKKWFGWEPEDLIGTDGFETVHPKDLEYIKNEFYELLKEHGSTKTIEYRYKNKDDTYKWIELTAANLLNNPSINGVLMNYKDITERRHDRENLKLNELRYQKAQKLGKVGNWEYNLQTAEFWGSDQAKRVYGFDPDNDKFTTDEVENCIPEREQVHQALIDLIEKEKEYNLQFDIISKNDKKRKTIISIAELEKDENGNPLKVTGVIHDITELRKSNEELEIKNKQLQTIFTAAKNVSFIITDAKDPEPSVLEFSPGAENIFGYNRDEIIGKTVSKLHLLSDVEKFPEAHHMMREGKTGFSGETTLIRKSGEKFPALFSTYPLFDQSGNMYAAIGVSLDISEQKRLEKRVRQAQKMESIGNLAGGIAHDFNNLLFPIIGMSEMLLEDLPQDSPEHENVQEIFHAGRRAGELVNQILAFSRQSEHKIAPVRVQNVLKEVLKLGRSTIPTNIEIQQNIQQNCGLVLADSTQIHQVAMNLITNAYHAIEGKNGAIDIELKEIDLKNNDLPDSPLQPGEYVRLSVFDTGIGIDQSLIKNIFEPYFTTKEIGKGTGLGLAVVYGIVKEHGGDIEVYSEVGKGTTFNIYLPLMKKVTEAVSTKQASELATGIERILLVDDEVSVAKLEAQMLSRLGYQVTAETSSRDTLNVFKLNPESFDLIISDMTMPDMTGDQLAKNILSIRPEMPIVICTGFSEKINKEQAESIGVKGFLMKPVVKSEMAKMV